MPSKPATRSGTLPAGVGSNAHLRAEGEQPEPAQQAGQAHRLLDDPAFKQGHSALKSECIRQIIGLVQDGSPETAELERILCANLRVIEAFPRAMNMAVQGQVLRDFNFRQRQQLKPKEAGETDED